MHHTGPDHESMHGQLLLSLCLRVCVSLTARCFDLALYACPCIRIATEVVMQQLHIDSVQLPAFST